MQNRQTKIYVHMRLRDHMRRDYFADSLAGGGACIDSTADSSYITTNDSCDQTGIDLFPADKTNIRGLHHRIGGFDHRNQPTAFHHSECFRHQQTSN
jgi:hypothetical protein